MRPSRCRQVLDIFRPWHPVCSGHGVPMYKHGAQRWRCRVRQLAWKRARWANDPECRERSYERLRNDPEYRERRLQRNRERYANDPEHRERARERDRAYYHRPNGGWLKKRKRDLAASRAGVLRRLEELDESFS